MRVNGFMFREVLKRKRRELKILDNNFEDTLFTFPDEEQHTHPINAAERIATLEVDIARLQTAQAEYNMAVEVEPESVGSEIWSPTNLAQAIRMVGSAGRMVKRWEEAAASKRDNWRGRVPESRSSDEVFETEVIPKDRALKLALEAERVASQLRTVIAQANATMIDIEWVDESLFS